MQSLCLQLVLQLVVLAIVLAIGCACMPSAADLAAPRGHSLCELSSRTQHRAAPERHVRARRRRVNARGALTRGGAAALMYRSKAVRSS